MTEDRFMVCDEKDWEGLTPDQRTWMLYKTMRNIETRLTAIETKSLMHKAFAAAGGVVGGFVAFLATKWVIK